MTAEGVVSIAAVHAKQKIVKLQAKWEQKRLSEISRKPFVDGFQNPYILFGQLSNDLIDDLAVSLALQFAHNSLHDLPLIFRSQNLCEFLFQN